MDQVHTSLIKPRHTFHAMFHRPRGDLQPRGSELVTQEIETPTDPADEGLVGVLLKLQLRQRLVHQPDRHDKPRR